MENETQKRSPVIVAMPPANAKLNSHPDHSTLSGPGTRKRTLLRALVGFQIFSLVYNIEHGIVPAALPQIRHFYSTNGLLEALIQCVSVFGTQLGVFFVTTHKLPLTKPLLLGSIILMGVTCVLTRFTVVEPASSRDILDHSGDGSLEIYTADGAILNAGGFNSKKRIPIWIFIWRFVAGLLCSYPVNLVPRWINLAFREDCQPRQAHLQLFGIAGTMIGYALTLCSPYQTTTITPTGPSLVSNNQILGYNRTEQFLWKIYNHLTTPFDFRRAFLWTAYLAFLTAIAGAVLIDPSALTFDSKPTITAGEGGTEPEINESTLQPTEFTDIHSDDPDLSSFVNRPNDNYSQPVAMYHPNGFHTISQEEQADDQTRSNQNRWSQSYQAVQNNNCLLWMPFSNEVQSFIDNVRHRSYTEAENGDLNTEQSIWKDLKELWLIPEYVGLVGCVWVDTTAAQGVNFWLFTAYTLGMDVSPTWAITGVAIVFVLGTILGLWISTRIESCLKGEIRVVRGICVPKEVLLTMTCLSGAATLFGGVTVLVSGYWKTTLAFTLAVVAGAAVIPIAQAAVGQCAPAHLHETAYGSYQFVFQSTWFFGPLVPVFIAWCCDSTVETAGLRFVILLPLLGLLAIFVAYRHRRSVLLEADEIKGSVEGLDTEMTTLLPPQYQRSNGITAAGAHP